MLKTKLTLTTAITAFTMLTIQAAGIKDKALLYLSMDEGKVIAKPADAKIDMLGTSKPIFKPGKKGQAIAIDSEDVSIKGIAVKGQKLIKGETGTIAFWMKPLVSYTSEKGRHYYFAARKSNGHLVYIMSPKGGFYFQTVKDKKWMSPHFNFSWWKKPQWSTETWYHLTITWGPGEKTIFYVNGNPVHKANDKNSISLNTDTVFIGCSNNKKFQADALLDEFLVFDSILTKEDIASLINE